MSSSPLKVLFMGTGDIALPAFSHLITIDSIEMLGLVTQPDKPVGRKQVLTPPKIKEVALEHNLPVWQPQKAKSKNFLAEMESITPDIIIVMAYGQILTQRLIDTPTTAIINVHASLLPLYRGASCIQGPIADGHQSTGVTIMHVVKALDAGDIILQVETPISEEDTGGSVHDRLAGMTPDLLTKAITQLATNTASRTPQDDTLSTYAPKLLRGDGELNCEKPAVELERLIRAYHPWPGTYTTFTDRRGKPRRLKVTPPTSVIDYAALQEGELKEVEKMLLLGCAGNTALQLHRVQPEGSKAMSADDFLKGNVLL